ncbi:MAG: glycosyl hydrolase family 17 protein [Patescibacteria group bacterium]
MRFKIVATLFLALTIAGCGSTGKTVMRETAPVKMVLQFSETRTSRAITAVNVTVTGVEIDPPVIANLTQDGSGVWTGTFNVPCGISRTFLVQVMDGDRVVYSGSKTQDIVAGQSNTMAVTVYPDLSTNGIATIHVGVANAYTGIGRIGVTFGPYTVSGQSPGTDLPETQIAQQFEVIGRYCRIVRTYSATHGCQLAAKYAEQKGILCWLGVDIGTDLTANIAEISGAVQTATSYPLAGIIVGNEAIMRGEQDATAMTGYVNQVKSQVAGVPVSVAETWDIWYNDGAGQPELAAAVDQIVVNIHPYWRGVPVESAVTYIADCYTKVQSLYPDKVIIVGEIGWPSEGNPNGSAVPSAVNQRNFLTVFVWADQNGVTGFLFEMFDEPWKVGEPGGVGTHWGLFDSNLAIKPEIARVWF